MPRYLRNWYLKIQVLVNKRTQFIWALYKAKSYNTNTKYHKVTWYKIPNFEKNKTKSFLVAWIERCIVRVPFLPNEYKHTCDVFYFVLKDANNINQHQSLQLWGLSLFPSFKYHCSYVVKFLFFFTLLTAKSSQIKSIISTHLLFQPGCPECVTAGQPIWYISNLKRSLRQISINWSSTW